MGLPRQRCRCLDRQIFAMRFKVSAVTWIGAVWVGCREGGGGVQGRETRRQLFSKLKQLMA